MSLEHLALRVPDYAKDLRINLGVIAGSTSLTTQQAWGTAVAAAVTSKSREAVDAVIAEAGPLLSPEAVAAARGAASIMAMNTVYYRFTHMLGDGEYSSLPARLRMQIIGKPGVDSLDFELWCLACAAIEGCEKCLRAHEKAVRERGGTREAVQDAVRIAAVINGVALTLATT
jgi:lipoyl-dependent peroxiredoxin subunit D